MRTLLVRGRSAWSSHSPAISGKALKLNPIWPTRNPNPNTHSSLTPKTRRRSRPGRRAPRAPRPATPGTPPTRPSPGRPCGPAPARAWGPTRSAARGWARRSATAWNRRRPGARRRSKATNRTRRAHVARRRARHPVHGALRVVGEGQAPEALLAGEPAREAVVQEARVAAVVTGRCRRQPQQPFVHGSVRPHHEHARVELVRGEDVRRRGQVHVQREEVVDVDAHDGVHVHVHHAVVRLVQPPDLQLRVARVGPALPGLARVPGVRIRDGLHLYHFIAALREDGARLRRHGARHERH